MGKIRDSAKLLGEFVSFARERRAYWIVPLVIVLGLTAFLFAVAQTAAPLLYTLF